MRILIISDKPRILESYDKETNNIIGAKVTTRLYVDDTEPDILAIVQPNPPVIFARIYSENSFTDKKTGNIIFDSPKLKYIVRKFTEEDTKFITGEDKKMSTEELEDFVTKSLEESNKALWNLGK